MERKWPTESTVQRILRWKTELNLPWTQAEALLYLLQSFPLWTVFIGNTRKSTSELIIIFSLSSEWPRLVKCHLKIKFIFFYLLGIILLFFSYNIAHVYVTCFSCIRMDPGSQYDDKDKYVPQNYFRLSIIF